MDTRSIQRGYVIGSFRLFGDSLLISLEANTRATMSLLAKRLGESAPPG
jgi:hypothetical protein